MSENRIFYDVLSNVKVTVTETLLTLRNRTEEMYSPWMDDANYRST